MHRVIESIQTAPRSSVFVFPSEIIASFWRRKYLDSNRAVRADRFISWDVFKENGFLLTQVAVPVNRLVRMLFAADLLKRNAAEGFLEMLILPARAEAWKPFVKSIAGMLPLLDRLLREEDISTWLDQRYRRDFMAIGQRYRDFLARHGLFEPSFEPIVPAQLDRSYIVFFPSVIQDYDEFAPYLDQTHVTVVDAEDVASGPIGAYANSRHEIRAFCIACRELLDAGVPSTDIVVTLATSAGYVEELRDEAALFDLPLALRIGKPLADYPIVRLYRLLSSVVTGGYSVDALKQLLLNTVFPWKSPELGRRLVAFGIEHFGLRNFSQGGRYRDLWDQRLSASPDVALRGFYRTLRRSAEAVVMAKTFDDLRQAVLLFNSRFLQTDRLGVEQERSFSAALDELPRLQDAANLVPSLEIESPYSLWSTSLMDRQYVQATRSGGIPVYEYRVAAGIRPSHHFILGAGQGGVSVKQPRYPFLPANLLPEQYRDGRDFSGAFLDLYAASGGQVSFSYSKESYDGPALAPDRFLLSDSVVVPDDTWRSTDPYRHETEVWAGTRETPDLVFSLQKAGIGTMASAAFLDKGFSLVSNPVADSNLAELLKSRQTSDYGEIRISPTGLDSWSSCRFAYLLSGVLGLREHDYDVVYQSARQTGVILHRVFAAVTLELDRLAKEQSPDEFEPSKIFEIVADTLDRWQGPRFIPPVWADQRRSVAEIVDGFLAAEQSFARGTSIHSVEDSFEIRSVHPGVTLHGRIDRISKRDDLFIIIDYKKRLWRKRSGMVAPDGSLITYQIPCYVLLVEDQCGAVGEALYYDMTAQKYEVVFGEAKPWFDDNERAGLEIQTRSAIAQMSEAITNGAYQPPSPRGSCLGCDFRAICREKYLERQ